MRLGNFVARAFLNRLLAKLGYAGIGALVLGLVSEMLGVNIAPDEVDIFVTAGSAVAAIYGRWIAARLPRE